MSQWLEWLLGLDRIRLGDAPLSVQWSPPAEAWQLFGGALLLGAIIVYVIWRERVSKTRRLVALALRMVLLALVVVAICRPVLVLQRERVEPSWVALLVDTSQSMGRADTYPDKDLADSIASAGGVTDQAALASTPRLELVRAAIESGDAMALRTLMQHNEIGLFAFDQQCVPKATAQSPSDVADVIAAMDTLAPSGQGTDVAGALEKVLDAVQGRHLSAVVLASDGRDTSSGSIAAVLGRFQADGIPILPIRIGSEQPPVNLAITAVMAEENVFPEDLVAIQAQIAATGIDERTPITIHVFDEQLASEVARQTIEIGGEDTSGSVELRFRAGRPGKPAYQVRVDPLPDETLHDDNTDRVTFRVMSDKLRVLYVESGPRYEYRYLKNALVRESTIESSVLLLNADQHFAQEGTAPIIRFPVNEEELAAFDVILFGDVDPTQTWLSQSQQEMIVHFVGQEGGGFGMVAGEHAAPHRFRGTLLEKLIPVRIDPSFLGRYETSLTTDFKPLLTLDGKRARSFRFDGDAERSESLFDNLPGIYWYARTLGPKPGAEVLLEHPQAQAVNGAMPLLTVGRYGAGRTMFLATDDTWRWRRHNGEFLHDIFWVQTLRTLKGVGRTTNDQRLRIVTDRSQYTLGDEVEIRVEIRDPELLAAQGDDVRLDIVDATTSPAARIVAPRIGPQAAVFEVRYAPEAAGTFTIRADDITPLPGRESASATYRVSPADLEHRQPAADHKTLQLIAERTGGEVVELDGLSAAWEQIEDRSVRIPADVTEPLWDSRLVFILFVLIITVEWVLRKAFGLL